MNLKGELNLKEYTSFNLLTVVKDSAYKFLFQIVLL